MSGDYSTISEFYRKLGAFLEDNSKNIFPVPNDNQSPLFALIIGINFYQHVPSLRGAVPDALAFKHYLRTHLSIQEQQITTLLDKEATRSKIIEAFKALKDDKRIKRGDAIVIFYAGHGSELAIPPGWKAGGAHIQALIPQDAHLFGATENAICAIPDRTIATLLESLVKEKGDNITVIFDCCYAASGTRSGVPYRLARSVKAERLLPIPSDVDSDILPDERNLVPSKGFAYEGLRSHILLAACASNEEAYETNGNGDFTTALLNLLITFGADRVTYAGLIQKFPALQKQRPQCEGHVDNVNRIFFNAKVSGANRMFVSVRQEENVCFLNAGIEQGITVGAVFDIFTSHVISEDNRRLGSMRVVAIEPLRSVLDWEKKTEPFELPEHSYAYQTKCGAGQALRVHFTDAFMRSIREKDGPEWTKLFSANEHSVVLELVNADVAQFIVDIDRKSEEVVFETRHSLSNKNGLTRLPDSVPNKVEDVIVVLRSAALWTWHLNRTNPENPFKHGVEFEFTRVVRDGYGKNSRPHLRAEGPNLNVSGVVDFVARRGELYGMKITNNTPRNLYAYLFYFDACNQSITPMMDSNVGGLKSEANLPPKNSVTIGYGSGGQSPFSFAVEDGQQLEVGILKLFFTTVQGEFGTVGHTSPFIVVKGERGGAKDTDVSQHLASHVDWDAFEITLIQRKQPFNFHLQGPSPPLDYSMTGTKARDFAPVKTRSDRHNTADHAYGTRFET